MSYEKNIPVKTKCPCGEGFIIQESKSNDWLQVKDLKLYIDCPTCREKYELKSEYFCPKPMHDVTIYYLIDKNTGEKIKLNI